MINFKGLPGAKIEKELNSLPLVKNKKIYVATNKIVGALMLFLING